MSTLDQIITRCKTRYGSLDSPTFFFVEQAIESQPYRELVDQIARIVDNIKETTDTNEDVSLVYVLQKSSQQWMIQLSMIGPYGLLLRLGNPNVVVGDKTVLQSGVERQIVDLLRFHSVELLGQPILESHVPLQLLNAAPDKTLLYQALFTNTDRVPWETAQD